MMTEESCWICLSGAEVHQPLQRPCSCPRYVHRTCLGRWQLQCAGRRDEFQCRFCGATLPRLDETLTPPHLREVHVIPYIAVIYKGECFKVPIKPGTEGMAEFRARVKCLFGMSHDAEFHVSFECASPSGEILNLDGMECFNAAATCATISAAKRAVGEDAGFTWDERMTV
ncbi:hypothetical protein Vretifemale_5689 [Volvox reticuliferus]|uniref:RING-CH-type domain-containing protein n=1 Tax=Volvox reticuliferus TaxID=1737510 RepID=A0A8J4FLX5_9CHLO|nr:hypothetical protein Vretifemale_5689 [Volvox reticuliferus]